MTFEEFKDRVKSIADKTGGNLKVRFSNSDGKHCAYCEENDEHIATITGNTKSVKMTVRWGSGHQSVFA